VGRPLTAPKLCRNSRKTEISKIDRARPEKTQTEESSPPLSSEWILRAKKIPLPRIKRIMRVSKVPKKDASLAACSSARQLLQGKKTRSKINQMDRNFDFNPDDFIL
jgi:hypothetical protein